MNENTRDSIRSARATATPHSRIRPITARPGPAGPAAPRAAFATSRLRTSGLNAATTTRTDSKPP
eukprot:2063337-Pleurochrysis_carterae.AAC.1